MNPTNSIVLLAFYNKKALGVRYLEQALRENGYRPYTIYFKNFHSAQPSHATPEELALLQERIRRLDPLLVGLSVMSSLYLDTVHLVHDAIRQVTEAPICWGGVYPTMYPARALEKADFVIRGEGEAAMPALARAVSGQAAFHTVANLAYKKDGQVMLSPLAPLVQNLDQLHITPVGNPDCCTIDQDQLKEGDLQKHDISYETAASRGCPYTCSYCCSVSLKRIHKGAGKFVRLRSVDNVIAELKQAKAQMPRLCFIHFWDEIFCDDREWVEEFAQKYRQAIHLPFVIWGHPLKTDVQTLRLLVSAGLYEVIMGIQSGSDWVRKEIFHRYETREQIYQAARAIKEAKVPWVTYDFMLQHPFETEDTIRETYQFCADLPRGYELQLHGLNFLPGTDIVSLAVDRGLFTKDELEEIMHSSIHRQFALYWKINDASPLSKFWYALIYLTQFPAGRQLAQKMAAAPARYLTRALTWQKIFSRLQRPRYYYKKGRLLLFSLFQRLPRKTSAPAPVAASEKELAGKS